MYATYRSISLFRAQIPLPNKLLINQTNATKRNKVDNQFYMYLYNKNQSIEPIAISNAPFND